MTVFDGDYRLLERFPGIDDYRRLRVATGLSSRSAEAAARGLPNTIFGVSVLHADQVIGMAGSSAMAAASSWSPTSPSNPPTRSAASAGGS